MKLKRIFVYLGITSVLLLSSCGLSRTEDESQLEREFESFQVTDKDMVILTHQKNSCKEAYELFYEKYYKHKGQVEEKEKGEEVYYTYKEDQELENLSYVKMNNDSVLSYTGEIEIKDGESNPTDQEVEDKVFEIIENIHLDHGKEYQYRLFDKTRFTVEDVDIYQFETVYKDYKISSTCYQIEDVIEAAGDIQVDVQNGKIVYFQVYGNPSIVKEEKSSAKPKYKTAKEVLKWVNAQENESISIKVKRIELVYGVNPPTHGKEELVPMVEVKCEIYDKLIDDTYTKHFYIDLEDGSSGNSNDLDSYR